MSENEQHSKIKDFFTSESTLKVLFITAVGGISAVMAFSSALSTTKKNDNTKYDHATYQLRDSGSQLAMRALKWGTFFSVTGCSLIAFGIWKLSGAKNMEDFNNKMGSLFPPVPKNYPQSRGDFASITEFLQYLDDEYSTKKELATDNTTDISSSDS